jgi:hypothetical protein
MALQINQELSSSAAAGHADVLQMKRALNRLGYYLPNPDIGMTDIPDRELFHGLNRYQVNNGLPGTGMAKPGDRTIESLNASLLAATDGNYVWRTADDGRVRPDHAVLNGTVRAWNDSPDPGDDYNCRCWAEPSGDGRLASQDAIEPVYPELYIIPLLRGGTFVKNAWELWQRINKRDPEWVFGRFKKPQKWARQIEERGWTPQMITDTIKRGVRHRAPNKVNPGNTATRYEWNGNYVVRDDRTKEILHVGAPHFMRKSFE